MPKRVDQNQAEIVAALRAVGCSVQILSDVGKGCPDLLVGVLARREARQVGYGWIIGMEPVNILLEVKSPGGKLNQREREWHEAWRGQVVTVHSVDEALTAVGLIGFDRKDYSTHPNGVSEEA